jgi:membrane-anchored glycerophosphoryl diester phosphodiesterase (GDPDase)
LYCIEYGYEYEDDNMMVMIVIVIAIIEIEYSICLYIEFDDINRIAFKISKIFRRVNKRMKAKKQKGSSSTSKK